MWPAKHSHLRMDKQLKKRIIRRRGDSPTLARILKRIWPRSEQAYGHPHLSQRSGVWLIEVDCSSRFVGTRYILRETLEAALPGFAKAKLVGRTCHPNAVCKALLQTRLSKESPAQLTIVDIHSASICSLRLPWADVAAACLLPASPLCVVAHRAATSWSLTAFVTTNGKVAWARPLSLAQSWEFRSLHPPGTSWSCCQSVRVLSQRHCMIGVVTRRSSRDWEECQVLAFDSEGRLAEIGEHSHYTGPAMDAGMASTLPRHPW